MLMQSHMGSIDLLPALPAAWPNGSIRGLRARGGYRVDISWANGKLTKAWITPDQTASVVVRFADRTWTMSAKAGETMVVG